MGQPKNSSYNVYPREGSSRYATTGTLYSGMKYQHNNGNTESHDICTLGNTGNDVWNSGMYWGNIDATSNYGGLMNQYMLLLEVVEETRAIHFTLM